MAKCKACGRPLTDPVSVAVGLGPVCRGGSSGRGRRSGSGSRRPGGGGSYSDAQIQADLDRFVTVVVDEPVPAPIVLVLSMAGRRFVESWLEDVAGLLGDGVPGSVPWLDAVGLHVPALAGTVKLVHSLLLQETSCKLAARELHRSWRAICARRGNLPGRVLRR